MADLPEHVGDPEAGRGVRAFVLELRDVRDVSGFIDTATTYGWAPVVLALALHGTVRGVFEHLTDPFIIASGYWFPGWQFALLVNIVYGTAIVVFGWFLFFGLVASIGGYLSSVRHMDVGMFKIGAYLSLVFIPVFVIGSIISLTLTVPEALVVGTADETAHTYVRRTLQLQLVAFLRGLTWIVIGFVLLPIVADRYALDRKASVVAVLPPTMGAILATQLV